MHLCRTLVYPISMIQDDFFWTEEKSLGWRKQREFAKAYEISITMSFTPQMNATTAFPSTRLR